MAVEGHDNKVEEKMLENAYFFASTASSPVNNTGTFIEMRDLDMIPVVKETIAVGNDTSISS